MCLHCTERTIWPVVFCPCGMKVCKFLVRGMGLLRWEERETYWRFWTRMKESTIIVGYVGCVSV